ncbi:hypothetical protein FA95DRAFT_817246 [Auriscalpium vulgare]|uniref:Uncharacterized protein n=1 Tax=Auriscalpium vulgare TaxID=40419 RepID=A0ACB8S012_9AGAM|nr:hypothetical protein FA95DRAFT_817246 [Auriscalpium vulgare]
MLFESASSNIPCINTSFCIPKVNGGHYTIVIVSAEWSGTVQDCWPNICKQSRRLASSERSSGHIRPTKYIVRGVCLCDERLPWLRRVILNTQGLDGVPTSLILRARNAHARRIVHQLVVRTACSCVPKTMESWCLQHANKRQYTSHSTGSWRPGPCKKQASGQAIVYPLFSGGDVGRRQTRSAGGASQRPLNNDIQLPSPSRRSRISLDLGSLYIHLESHGHFSPPFILSSLSDSARNSPPASHTCLSNFIKRRQLRAHSHPSVAQRRLLRLQCVAVRRLILPVCRPFAARAALHSLPPRNATAGCFFGREEARSSLPQHA